MSFFVISFLSHWLHWPFQHFWASYLTQISSIVAFLSLIISLASVSRLLTVGADVHFRCSTSVCYHIDSLWSDVETIYCLFWFSLIGSRAALLPSSCSRCFCLPFCCFFARILMWCYCDSWLATSRRISGNSWGYVLYVVTHAAQQQFVLFAQVTFRAPRVTCPLPWSPPCCFIIVYA